MPLSLKTQPPVESYMDRLRASLQDVPDEHRAPLLEQARAKLDLALELELADDETSAARVVDGLEPPETLARELRAQLPERVPSSILASCRSCQKHVSREARACPHCGAPFPAQQAWNGIGRDWKSKQTLWGLPLVHVAYGRDAQGKLRVAKGIVAIGQFGIGAITIAQFGVGAVFGLGQFVVAPIAVGQFALGLAAIGQFGFGILFGLGQFATGLKAIGLVTPFTHLGGR
jgi:hypothetical protein